MLHSVPAPAEEQRPRKTFPELVASIYEDPRVGHEARELLLAVAYAVDLAKREDGVSPLKVARRKLGVEHGRQARYDRLMADDAPRYDNPQADRMPSTMSCAGPRLRPYRTRPYKPRTTPDPDLVAPTWLREPPPPKIYTDLARGHTYTPPRDWRTEDRVCGATAHHQVVEKDPRTGWVTVHWFCKRHKEEADRVAEQVREQNEQAPEPIPNRGGLLPCYFKADWEKVYRHYRPRWTAPVYGIAADDWPSPERRCRVGTGGCGPLAACPSRTLERRRTGLTTRPPPHPRPGRGCWRRGCCRRRAGPVTAPTNTSAPATTPPRTGPSTR